MDVSVQHIPVDRVLRPIKLYAFQTLHKAAREQETLSSNATSETYAGRGVGHRMYRSCIVTAGRRDRWVNSVLLGDVGHWAWLTIHCY